MPSGTSYKGYMRNDTLFDGTGDKTPISAGDAVNISFYAKKIGTSGGMGANNINVYLSQDGTTEFTCIIGKRKIGQPVVGGTYDERFSPSNDWTRFNYTAEAPAEDGDNDYAGGSAVSTWTTCSIQITGSTFIPLYPNSQQTYATAYDDFQVTANKPQVHVSNEGILIYQTGDNYIEMGAEGLNVKGGNINSNIINAPVISSEDFQVKSQISNYLTSSDISVQTADTSYEASGDLYLKGGTCSLGGTTAGSGGGHIYLQPGSGSGTDNQLSGSGAVILGPATAPRLIISGTDAPTGGHTDSEIRLKDNEGDDASLFWSKQTNANGCLGIKTTQANSSIVLGGGNWGNHILIRSDGEVHIPGGGNDAAQSHRLFVTGNVKIDTGALGVDATASSTDGHIRAANDIVAFYSDERLKEKITIGIENPIDKIKNINTFTYRHNELANTLGFEGDKIYIGVGAKSVKESLPEAVEIAPFDADKDGNSESGEDYLTVQYERIVPLLLEGIKEQQIQIDELKREIEEIKNG
jgi:hypothetical protein